MFQIFVAITFITYTTTPSSPYIHITEFIGLSFFPSYTQVSPPPLKHGCKTASKLCTSIETLIKRCHSSFSTWNDNPSSRDTPPRNRVPLGPAHTVELVDSHTLPHHSTSRLPRWSRASAWPSHSQRKGCNAEGSTPAEPAVGWKGTCQLRPTCAVTLLPRRFRSLLARVSKPSEWVEQGRSILLVGPEYTGWRRVIPREHQDNRSERGRRRLEERKMSCVADGRKDQASTIAVGRTGVAVQGKSGDGSGRMVELGGNRLVRQMQGCSIRRVGSYQCQGEDIARVEG